MGYVKYSKEQLKEREHAKKAIMAARAHLKGLREAKKAKKEQVITLRRELKAEIRRRKEAGLEKRRKERDEKALKKKCRPLLAVLRRVYKPYMVARRKVNRLRIAKRKAELAADRKMARESAKAAKELLKSLEQLETLKQERPDLHREISTKIIEKAAKISNVAKRSPKKKLKINTAVKSENTDPPLRLNLKV